MSACVSKHGEYSEHEPGEGARRYLCQRCWVFDEDSAIARIAVLEAALDGLLADATVHHVLPDDVVLIGNVNGRSEDIPTQVDLIAKHWPGRRVAMFAGDIEVAAWTPLPIPAPHSTPPCCHTPPTTG